MRVPSHLLLALLAVTPACGQLEAPADSIEDSIDVGDDAKTDKASTTSTYFLMRQDFRKCVSPLCGGVWVHRVNQKSTRCANGRSAAECYVAEIDLQGLGLTDEEQATLRNQASSGQALLRGSIRSNVVGTFGNVGKFVATEGWAAATANPPTGTFYSLKDNGIRCITTPCNNLHQAKLNSTTSRDISGVKFKQAGAEQAQVDAAHEALYSGGVLAVGTNGTDELGGAFLDATQFYLRVTSKGGCTYNGKTYSTGESFPSADGCNTCSCSDSGAVFCTLRACVATCDPKNEPTRDYISTDPAQCAAILFLCVEGMQPFFNDCGCGCEPTK